MLHRKIRTKKESMESIPFLIIFVIIWYTVTLRPVIKTGFSSVGTSSIFLLAGLLPLGIVVQTIRRVCYYRRLHRQYMNQRPRKGKIVSCVRGSYRERSSKGSSRIVYEYFLKIEVYDPDTMLTTEIQSEAYSWPVYRALSSPDVEVYTDETGWHHVIDGFQYKTSKNDPDIFIESSFDKEPGQNMQMLFRVIFFVIFVIVILRSLHIIS